MPVHRRPAATAGTGQMETPFVQKLVLTSGLFAVSHKHTHTPCQARPWVADRRECKSVLSFVASASFPHSLPQISHSQLLNNPLSSSALNSAGDYGAPHPAHSPAMMSSYGNAYSSTGSTSSRSNSRPSTANSLPPSRFPGLDAQYSPQTSLLPSVESREPYITRWETLPQIHRQETSPYGYHPSAQDNSLMSRDYAHDHSGRI